MEFIIFLSNTILIGAVIHWCLVNSGRKPGTPVKGFFAYRTPPEKTAAEPKPRPGTWQGRP